MTKKNVVRKASAKPMTKSEIVSGIADATGLTKKDVNSVFEAMAAQIQKSLGRSGAGVYTVPALMKLIVQGYQSLHWRRNYIQGQGGT